MKKFLLIILVVLLPQMMVAQGAGGQIKRPVKRTQKSTKSNSSQKAQAPTTTQTVKKTSVNKTEVKASNTNNSIPSSKTSASAIAGEELSLNDLLTKVMGKVNLNPMKESYQNVKNNLSSNYTLEDSSSDSFNVFYIESYNEGNDSMEKLIFHGFHLDSYYFTIHKDPNDNISRRIDYRFNQSKDNMQDPFIRLDEIVREFNKLGINLKYEKKNEEYTKAKGEVVVGNYLYGIELMDYTYSWMIRISHWLLKNKI